jgi:putative transcriptional regulator
MYHYRECGLDDVWLANGYRVEQTPYGEAVAIEDAQGLHRAIARMIVEKPGKLTGKEFRFLRTELGMSQKKLGEFLGADAQAIARWERGVSDVPGPSDRLIRVLYRECVEGNAMIRQLVERINSLDEAESRRPVNFTHDDEWRPIAA